MIGRCSSSTELNKFQTLNGLQHLAEARRFKAWFLDQFGVLHDGKLPYPGAVSTLEKLATCGAKMVIISNSSRRASTTIEKLSGLGFDPSLFLGAITSGELTHQYLLSRDDPWFARLGRSCIHLTWSDRGAISLEGLGLQVVGKVEDADFVLAHGTEALGRPSRDALPMSLEEINKILGKCAAKKIPMVVANPDFVTVEARALRVMPGTLAATYEKLGGEVKWMGKPDEIIYKSAMEMVGVEPGDCIAVGDSLHHDIKGANIAGISSALITGGIHATELGIEKFGETADDAFVHSLATKCDAYPTYVIPSFTWEESTRNNKESARNSNESASNDNKSTSHQIFSLLCHSSNSWTERNRQGTTRNRQGTTTNRHLGRRSQPIDFLRLIDFHIDYG